MEKRKVASRLEFAKAEGVSKVMVGRWVKAGLPVLTDGRIDVKAGRAWLQANILNRSEEGESFSAAKARKESALASLRELELAERKGQLLDREEVKQAVEGLVIQARETLMGVPSQVQDRLTGMTSAPAIGELLEAEIRRALMAISQYEPGKTKTQRRINRPEATQTRSNPKKGTKT